MDEMQDKPVGWFWDRQGVEVLVIPKAGEAPDDAKKRVTEAHGLPPTVVKPMESQGQLGTFKKKAPPTEMGGREIRQRVDQEIESTIAARRSPSAVPKTGSLTSTLFNSSTTPKAEG